MERIFLCCFRSCLKGDDDKELYTILEIEDSYRATTDQIKKQYKKLSLSMHPDKLSQKGVEVTAEHKQQFIRLKEAYDVLSDPKRRRLYDEYGLTGLKLMENPAELNHIQLLKNFQKNHGDRTTLTLAILGIFASIIILPILFSLKCDGTLGDDAKWVAIWTPMWLVDIFLLVSAGIILMDRGSKNHGEDEHGEGEESDKIPLYEKISNAVTTTLFILIQIFVLIRLDKYTDWSWFAIFIPWFLFEGISIGVAIPIAFLKTHTPPNHENNPLNVENGGEDEEAFMQRMQAETEYFEKILEQDREKRYILVHFLRIWLAIFLALQLDHDVDWNWGLVLLPIWIYLFMHYIYAFVYRLWGQSKMKDLDIEAIESGQVSDPIVLVKYQQGSMLLSNSVVFCFGQAVPLFMAIMLVCRLQVSDYSTFFIILPIFIIVGCCCCVVFCALCGMSMVDMETFEEGDPNHPNNVKPQNQANDPNHPYEPPVVIPESGDYGTFEASPSQAQPQQSQSPTDIEEGGNKKESTTFQAEPTMNPVSHSDKKETTIDVDID